MIADEPARSLEAMFSRTYTSPVPVAQHIEPPSIEAMDLLLRGALVEDVGTGDVTTEVLEVRRRVNGKLLARSSGVVAGLGVFVRVFELLDDEVTATFHAQDGDVVAAGDVVVEVEGPLAALLTGERTALNFVQRLSGIATLTRRFVDLAAGRARILDTRKTTPGLRQLEKLAVRMGGGENHRVGLFDEVMVKNNHLDLAGTSMLELLARLRERHGPDMRITAEARDEAEALQAVHGEADVVMLDNMSVAAMRELCPRLRAAASSRPRPLEIEASGSVDLKSVGAVAATGVDRISVGALTHSAPALDLAFRMEVGP
jgi:nicotinate-nucleotide pyrophosphorylase (carboxylating)